MNELRNSKSDDQLEELLLLTEQMQEELDQKDRTIRELKVQLDESLTLNEKLNSENKAGNIQALKNDLRKTKELLQSEKEKTHAAEIMTEECQDKLRPLSESGIRKQLNGSGHEKILVNSSGIPARLHGYPS